MLAKKWSGLSCHRDETATETEIRGGGREGLRQPEKETDTRLGCGWGLGLGLGPGAGATWQKQLKGVTVINYFVVW